MSGRDISRMMKLFSEGGTGTASERAEAGYPSMLSGGSPYKKKTDSDGVIKRPPFATPEVNEVIDSAIHYNPDTSHAAWMVKLLGLNEPKLLAYKLSPEGETLEPDEDAQREGRAFARRVFTAYGGGIDAMLEVALASVIHRGAVMPELDVSDSRDDVLDVDFIDPTAVDFKVDEDGSHRRTYPVFKPQFASEPKPFNPLTSCYFGINKGVGMPHGHSPFLTAIETAPRQMRYRKSLEKVIANSAFARTALELDFMAVARTAPKEIVKQLEGDRIEVQDWEAFAKFMNKRRDDVLTMAKSTHEDGIWVTWNNVKLTSFGADHSSKTIDPAKIAEILDVDSINSAHSQPSAHGRAYGSDLSSTGAVQWQVMALGIEAMRDYPARAVEFIFNSWARIRGMPVVFKLEFAEIRKEDRKAEAETDKIRTETAILQRDNNIIDDDEMAQRLVGHDAIVPEEPEEEPEIEDADPDDEPDDEDVDDDGDEEDDEEEEAEENALRNGNGHSRHVSPMLATHQGGCDCDGCESVEVLAVEPFEPETSDAESAPQIIARHTFDDDELDDAIKAFRSRARAITPSWRAFLDAIEVSEDVPEDDSENALFGTLAPRPRSEWKSDAWQWDSRIARYRYAPGKNRNLGRIVPQDRVRRMLDRHLTAERKVMKTIGQALTNGRIDVPEFQKRLAARSALMHVQARAMAIGGRDQMDIDSLLAARTHWLREAQFISNFGQQIARGEMSATAIIQRTQLYGEASLRSHYEKAARETAADAGYQEERWFLGTADHCEGCVAQASKLWVAIGSLPELGTQPCLVSCKCRKEQRYDAENRYPPRVLVLRTPERVAA